MDLLFELIQVVQGQRDRLSRNPSEEDWQKMFQMAEEQAVTSFVFPALEKLNKSGQKPPMELLYEWIGLAGQVRAQNELMNREAARLTALFENEGHRTAILKGQANARLYHCHTDITENTDKGNDLSMLRQPGDIDIWVSGGKERVVQTLRKLHLIDGGISKYYSAEKALDGYHHIHLQKNENGVDVEVHFKPSSGNIDPFTNRRLQKYLNQEIEKENEMVGDGFRVPSIRFALVMQLAHIQRHALESGVELRRVIDANPDEKRGRMLLDIIMRGGNFGYLSAERQQGFSFIRSLKYHIRKYELLRFDARETIWGEFNYYGRFITSIPERIRRRSWTLR